MKQFNQDNMKSISDYINNFYEDNPFTKHLGVDIVSIDKGNVCVSLTIKHYITLYIERFSNIIYFNK